MSNYDHILHLGKPIQDLRDEFLRTSREDSDVIGKEVQLISICKHALDLNKIGEIDLVNDSASQVLGAVYSSLDILNATLFEVKSQMVNQIRYGEGLDMEEPSEPLDETLVVHSIS